VFSVVDCKRMMRDTVGVVLFIFFLFIFVSPGQHVAALQCWECVGPDCDGPIDQSNFARTMQCEQGALCQKVQFAYLDITTNTSVSTVSVRGCSYPIGCDDSLTTGQCMADSVQFAGLGCEIRHCCTTNLCNGASLAIISSTVHILAIIIVTYLAV